MKRLKSAIVLGSEELLARLAAANPRLAFDLAGKFGSLRNRVTRRGPAPAEVRALLPDVDARRVSADIGALYSRNRVLVRSILRYGLDPIRSIVTGPERVDAPCILATFHVGAVHALGPALERLGKPVIAFRGGRIFEPRPPLTIESTKAGEQERAASFLRALESLRNGHVVTMALDDVPGGLAIETRCLGRRLRLARGAFALSEMTGAPIMPIVARWRGGGVQVVIDSETIDANTAGSWLERYLLANPSELTLGLLGLLLDEPLAQ